MIETLSDRLDRLMRIAGYNPSSLSRTAGLGQTAVRDILEGRVASPRYATLQAIAAVLGISVNVLVQEGDAETPDLVSFPARPPTSTFGAPPNLRDLPIFAAAEGGSSGALIMSSDPIQWIRRPEPLLTVTSAYGVFVVGDSMDPAYQQGDVVLIHPSLPPRRDADVILFREDPDGTRHVLLKRLIGWTERKWQVRQYNPEKAFDLSRSKWHEAQTVVGRYNSR